MTTPAPILRPLATAMALACTCALLATVLTGRSSAGTAEATAPSRAALDDIGVVTYNVLVHRSPGALRQEVARLAARPDVDIIGWQEANKLVHRPRSGGATPLQTLQAHGFQTVTFGKPKEPISWRASEFELVSTARHHMCRAAPRRARVNFPPKWLNVVTLRDRQTGHLMSVTNVHVAHSAEAWQTRPGRFSRLATAACAKRIYRQLARLWPTLPGRYVVAAGDWNFDYKTDRRRKPVGGMARTLGPLTVSNWQLLGYRPKARTVTMRQNHRPSRLIDWVLVNRQDVASGELRPLAHAVLRGYRSDHRPVLLRLAMH